MKHLHEAWEPTMNQYGVRRDAEWEQMREACWERNIVPLCAIDEANEIAVEAINRAMGK